MFFIFTTSCYVVFPLTKQIQEDFPENNIKGQICLRMEFTMDKTNLKQRIAGLIFPVLMTIFTWRFKNILTSFVRARNLNMRSFAQFGGSHQRNIFTLEHNWDYFVKFTAFTSADNSLTILFQFFRDQVGPVTRFFIQNFIWVLIINCFFSIYVPLKHLILSKEKLSSLWLNPESVTPSTFYVRKQKLKLYSKYSE